MLELQVTLPAKVPELLQRDLDLSTLVIASTAASAKIGIGLQIGPVNVRDSWILSSHLRQMSFTFSRV